MNLTNIYSVVTISIDVHSQKCFPVGQERQEAGCGGLSEMFLIFSAIR